MRAFIAIELDRPIKEALIGLVRELRSTRADVRWVAPAGMHLTLKFLGPIDDGQALRVKDIMVRAAGRHHAFPLKLEGTGAFPGEGSPRVLWVGIAAADELAALQADLDTALEAEGFEREKRDFRPHLTLGRVKGPDRLPRAMAELAKRRDESFGSMVATRITLFESLLHPEGAEYRTVLEVPLS
jgi:2'-5' RNA ligase